MDLFTYVETRPPFDLSDELQTKVNSAGVQSSIEEMRENGFGYIHDVVSPEFNERVRDTILRLLGEERNADPLAGGFVHRLLERDPIGEEIITHPKLIAMAEVMCGKGALLSLISATVRPKGSPGLGLHADQNWLPAPFPEHNQLLTICWACDPFNEENGSTTVVPGSHVHRRHPNHDEVKEEAGIIASECDAGSCVMWDGSVWHGNAPRTAEGVRVAIHITYCRLSMRTVESFSHLNDEWLSTRSQELRVLLGREDSLDQNDASFELVRRTAEWAKQ